MKRSPGTSSAWIPLLGIVVQMAALGLCSWAMASARNRGRELPAPPPAATVPPAP
jgi:hypothetical protein